MCWTSRFVSPELVLNKVTEDEDIFKSSSVIRQVGTEVDRCYEADKYSVSQHIRKPLVSGKCLYGCCFHGVFGRRSRMTEVVTAERQYKVAAKDLKPYTDKASSLLKELESHLRTFMVSPEKASTIMWLKREGKEQLTFIFDGEGLL